MATKNTATAKQVAQPQESQAAFVDIESITLPLGRPVDPNSRRQQRLAEYEAKRQQGILHRGRPEDPESPSYQKRHERLQKVEQGIELKRGRPVEPDSPRQKMLAKRNARLAILRAEALRVAQENATREKQVATLAKAKTTATKTTQSSL